MAVSKNKDTEDKKVLNTSSEGEGQGNQNSAPGTPPEGEGQGNQNSAPGTPPEGEGQGNQAPTPGTPPEGEGQNNQNPDPDKQPDAENTALYEITCRNKISKTIGGVMFVEGVGRTNDGYTASWFRNKEGYEVTKIE